MLAASAIVRTNHRGIEGKLLRRFANHAHFPPHRFTKVVRPSIGSIPTPYAD